MRAGGAEPAHAAMGLRGVEPADDAAEALAEGVERHGHRPFEATVPQRRRRGVCRRGGGNPAFQIADGRASSASEP
jgi:hypothetical protein